MKLVKFWQQLELTGMWLGGGYHPGVNADAKVKYQFVKDGFLFGILRAIFYVCRTRSLFKWQYIALVLSFIIILDVLTNLITGDLNWQHFLQFLLVYISVPIFNTFITAYNIYDDALNVCAAAIKNMNINLPSVLALSTEEIKNKLRSIDLTPDFEGWVKKVAAKL